MLSHQAHILLQQQRLQLPSHKLLHVLPVRLCAGQPLRRPPLPLLLSQGS